MRHLTFGSSRVDGVQFVADLGHGEAVVQPERTGAGRWANVLAGVQHVQHAVERHVEFGRDSAGRA